MNPAGTCVAAPLLAALAAPLLAALTAAAEHSARPTFAPGCALIEPPAAGPGRICPSAMPNLSLPGLSLPERARPDDAAAQDRPRARHHTVAGPVPKEILAGGTSPGGCQAPAPCRRHLSGLAAWQPAHSRCHGRRCRTPPRPQPHSQGRGGQHRSAPPCRLHEGRCSVAPLSRQPMPCRGEALARCDSAGRPGGRRRPAR